MKLLMVAIFAALTLSLTACGDDDDESIDPNASVVGTWKVNTMHLDDDWWQVDYIRFNENGTYQSVAVVCFMGDADLEKDSGTWSKKGDKMTIDGATATILQLDSKKMVLEYAVKVTYEKCPDSEMDQYL